MAMTPEHRAARELLDAAARLANADTGVEGEVLARRWLHAAGAALAARARQAAATPAGAEVQPSNPGAVPLEALWDVGGLEAARREHQAFLDELEAEDRARLARLKRRLTLMAVGICLGASIAGGLAYGVSRLLRPNNLLAGKPWVASSKALECHPDQHDCGGWKTDIFFHTKLEPSPWVRFDFGAPTTFSSLSIRNRQDMGLDRCVPMSVEVSDDAVTWREVAQRKEAFTVWSPSFPPTTARYLRLRVVGRSTWFHLVGVEAYR